MFKAYPFLDFRSCGMAAIICAHLHRGSFGHYSLLVLLPWLCFSFLCLLCSLFRVDVFRLPSAHTIPYHSLITIPTYLRQFFHVFVDPIFLPSFPFKRTHEHYETHSSI